MMPNASGNYWVAFNDDCVAVTSELEDESVDFSIFSPPFASLYAYSDDDRDMGNCVDHVKFFDHFEHLLVELLRVMRPGRNIAVHAMDLPTLKSRDGYVGQIDFSGYLVRAFEKAGRCKNCRGHDPIPLYCMYGECDTGFCLHSKHAIWKDPVIAQARTHAMGLQHQHLVRDSAKTRMGMADYLLVFRKYGENERPIKHEVNYYARADWELNGGSMDWDSHANTKARSEGFEFPLPLWQRWASPVWGPGDDAIDPSDVLPYTGARDEKDEKHICPLQLEVSRRAFELWSAPGDVVLLPFGGIGSEGYVGLGGKTKRGLRLKEPRKVIYVELKGSYFKQGIANLRAVEPGAAGEQAEIAWAPPGPYGPSSGLSDEIEDDDEAF